MHAYVFGDSLLAIAQYKVKSSDASLQDQNGASSTGQAAKENGSAAGSTSEDVPEGVQSARKWIAEWRSGQGDQSAVKEEREAQNV